MMHHMLGKKLSFSYRSKDSCISCTLDGNQLKKHIKAFSTRKFIRNFVENNFLVHNTFHDLHEDVVSYMLFLSINLFMHRFEKNSSYVKKNNDSSREAQITFTACFCFERRILY
uniref:Uncharacterized protein n=1 Tax=Strongyloides venezuelensis TaxID=75913 RepID=A0A0K0FB37_STRVS